MGALDHIIKPFDIEDLRSAIERQLKMHIDEPPPVADESAP
jgi:hypothetical protein